MSKGEPKQNVGKNKMRKLKIQFAGGFIHY